MRKFSASSTNKVSSNRCRRNRQSVSAKIVRISSTLLSLTLLLGCGENIQHDTELAARRAVEFPEIVFVRRNMEKGYLLLAGWADRSSIHFPNACDCRGCCSSRIDGPKTVSKYFSLTN